MSTYHCFTLLTLVSSLAVASCGDGASDADGRVGTDAGSSDTDGAAGGGNEVDGGAGGAGGGGDAGEAGGSGGGGSGGGGSDASPEAATPNPDPYNTTFQAYCSAILTADRTLKGGNEPGSWLSTNTKAAPKGTEFLLGVGFGTWEGFVVEPDGTPWKVVADTLTKDVDFISDCAPDAVPKQWIFALLANASFYDNDKLEGTPCLVPAGTAFQDHTYSPYGDLGVLSSPVLTSLCGFEKAWSSDLRYGDLTPVSATP